MNIVVLGAVTTVILGVKPYVDFRNSDEIGRDGAITGQGRYYAS
jgi:hypothetical protein